MENKFVVVIKPGFVSVNSNVCIQVLSFDEAKILAYDQADAYSELYKKDFPDSSKLKISFENNSYLVKDSLGRIGLSFVIKPLEDLSPNELYQLIFSQSDFIEDYLEKLHADCKKIASDNKKFFKLKKGKK